MEKKRHNFRLIATCIYAAFFAVYLYIGFQPVNSAHYEIIGQIDIPAINVSSQVANITLDDKTLTSPNDIVGAYSANPSKTLLIAHSTTAFRNLKNIGLGYQIIYKNQSYLVTNIQILAKADINMQDILSSTNHSTIILMTCTGTLLNNNDATHRLIVTAEKIEESGIIN